MAELRRPDDSHSGPFKGPVQVGYQTSDVAVNVTALPKIVSGAPVGPLGPGKIEPSPCQRAWTYDLHKLWLDCMEVSSPINSTITMLPNRGQFTVLLNKIFRSRDEG